MRLLIKPLSDVELASCLFFNRFNQKAALNHLFSLVNRLGNSAFWYGLMLVLPLANGVEGLIATLQMIITGIFSLAIYKALKSSTHHPRPHQAHDRILLTEPALDRFSFPSGHTMHAFGFTLVVYNSYPLLETWLMPCVGMIALSRLILGPHYPTDILVGAYIGTSISVGVTILIGV